jgi:hypothetical protein
MTKQSDLKKLVRERMEKTGERYAAARRNVRDEVPPMPPTRPQLPKGWQLAGASPQAYEATCERSHDGTMCARVQSRPDHTPQWTTLSQQFLASEYCGARLRLSARIRTAGQGEAKLWMRLDQNTAMRLINYSASVAGDEDYRACEIVLDVDDEITMISFGMIVAGTGAAWLRDLAIERVGLDVPTTATRYIQRHPTNLDFGE